MSKHRKLGQRDDNAGGPASSLDDVTSLINERRKFTDWIAALDAKREQTPKQVFVRVHADYEARLRSVVDKLAAHRGSLSTEVAAQEAKLSKVAAELEKQTDARAEIELRAHVGELDAEEVERALRIADQELTRLRAHHDGVESDLLRLREFLAATAADSTAPATGSRSSFNEMEFLQSVVGVVPPPVVQVDAAPAAAEMKAAAVEAPALVVEASAKSAAVDAPARRSMSVDKPAAIPTPNPPAATTAVVENAAPVPQAVPEPMVVEREDDLFPVAPPRPSAAVPKSADVRVSGIVKGEERGELSLLDGLGGSATDGEAPYAANVATNNPLSLKSSGPSDVKTLKCRECGAMNDPSEWYCERCGAELSAM